MSKFIVSDLILNSHLGISSPTLAVGKRGLSLLSPCFSLRAAHQVVSDGKRQERREKEAERCTCTGTVIDGLLILWPFQRYHKMWFHFLAFFLVHPWCWWWHEFFFFSWIDLIQVACPFQLVTCNSFRMPLLSQAVTTCKCSVSQSHRQNQRWAYPSPHNQLQVHRIHSLYLLFSNLQQFSFCSA